MATDARSARRPSERPLHAASQSVQSDVHIYPGTMCERACAIWYSLETAVERLQGARCPVTTDPGKCHSMDRTLLGNPNPPTVQDLTRRFAHLLRANSAPPCSPEPSSPPAGLLSAAEPLSTIILLSTTVLLLATALQV